MQGICRRVSLECGKLARIGQSGAELRSVTVRAAAGSRGLFANNPVPDTGGKTAMRSTKLACMFRCAVEIVTAVVYPFHLD